MNKQRSGLSRLTFGAMTLYGASTAANLLTVQLFAWSVSHRGATLAGLRPVSQVLGMIGLLKAPAALVAIGGAMALLWVGPWVYRGAVILWFSVLDVLVTQPGMTDADRISGPVDLTLRAWTFGRIVDPLCVVSLMALPLAILFVDGMRRDRSFVARV